MFVDIHVHTHDPPGIPRSWGGDTFATPAQVIARYEELGIEKGVILPWVNPECAYIFNSHEEVLEICEKHGKWFVPFCNVDPRMVSNSPDAPLLNVLLYYQDRGCRGVGEVCANLPFDDPLVENLLRACELAGMPFLFHVAVQIGGLYGLYDNPGLPRLEGALRKFPDLVFLGHSQAFWSEIGPLHDPAERGGYPTGPVEEPGRVVELMRRYPNLHGDLSAWSGYNAISRDEDFGASFLEEFQDRLYFGTDLCSPGGEVPQVQYLLRLRDEGKISNAAFRKIARENAVALLGL
ncbi:MAG: amidohydrolase family protein [Promethearchaeota archaeon]